MTGELTLWLLVGLLALESKEFVLRSSCDCALVCVGEPSGWEGTDRPLALDMSTRGTGCGRLASLVADVSMVIVGARGRRGPASRSSVMAGGRREKGCATREGSDSK